MIAAYHRALRRIAGMCHYKGSVRTTNEHMRNTLGMPCLQCIITKRRLLVLLAVARSGLSHLHALLSSQTAGETPLTRMQLIRHILALLASYHTEKLAELGEC